MAEIIDADYIKQRQVGTSSEHCVRRGDDIVALLPAATASVDGKMTKEQAQSVANSAVAGSDGQVQYNNNGALGADSNFCWDRVNKRLGIGTSNIIAALQLTAGREFYSGGTYGSHEGVWVGTRSSNGGAKVDFNTHTSADSSSSWRIMHDTDLTGAGNLAFSFASGKILRGDLSYSEYLRVNTTGLGINKTDPGAKLDVKGATTDGTASVAIFADSANAIKLSIRNDGQLRTSGGSVIDYGTYTSDATLTQSSKSCAVCNPSGEGVVLTMHLSPTDGIKQRTVNVSAFSVTLGRNSQKMAGLEANYTLLAYTAIDWQYYGATIGWLPISISTW